MKTKSEKSRNWQETEKERIQRRLEGGRKGERYRRKKRKFYFNESLAEGGVKAGKDRRRKYIAG